MTTLLPPNSTLYERKLAKTNAKAQNCDTEIIAKVTRTYESPVDFLSYLAWETSVDRWSENWSEETKRKVIDNSFYVHKRKGTIGSLRRVIEPFGYLLEVIEWFEETPPAQRGTFKLDIGVTNQGITDEVYYELERLILDTKPLSRHMSGLNVTILSHGVVHIGAATFMGDTTTVYPPSPQPIEIQSSPSARGATHLIDTTIVSPL